MPNLLKTSCASLGVALFLSSYPILGQKQTKPKREDNAVLDLRQACSDQNQVCIGSHIPSPDEIARANHAYIEIVDTEIDAYSLALKKLGYTFILKPIPSDRAGRAAFRRGNGAAQR